MNQIYILLRKFKHVLQRIKDRELFAMNAIICFHKLDRNLEHCPLLGVGE